MSPHSGGFYAVLRFSSLHKINCLIFNSIWKQGTKSLYVGSAIANSYLFIYLFIYLSIYLFIYSIIHFIFYSCHLYKVRSAIVMWKRKRQRTSYVSGKETTQQKVSTSDNALPGYSVMWPWKVFDRKTVGKRS